jgi:hypothetical protein
MVYLFTTTIFLAIRQISTVQTIDTDYINFEKFYTQLNGVLFVFF